MLSLVASTLGSTSNVLKCDEEIVSYYTSKCGTGAADGPTCGGGKFTTDGECTDADAGTTTCYAVPCGAAAKAFIKKSTNCGACGSLTSHDICAQPQSYKTCVVGGGIGAYGALVGYQAGGGALEDIMVFERGLDASYFAAQIGTYPDIALLAQQPWTGAKTSPWTNRYLSTMTGFPSVKTNTWAVAPFDFGGNFMHNGGLWMHGPGSTANLTSQEKDGLAAVTTSLGIAPAVAIDGVCGAPGGTDCAGIKNAIPDTTAYGNAVMHATLTTFEVSPTPYMSTRIDLQKKARAMKAQFKTGANVEQISKADGKFTLSGTGGSTLATCDKVILSAGAFNTPVLAMNAQNIGTCPNAGKFLSNQPGVITAVNFMNTPTKNYTAGFYAFPYATDPTGMSQTLVQCFPQDDIDANATNGLQPGVSCYVIVYAALQPDTYATDRVESDGTIHYDYILSDATKAAHANTYALAIDSIVNHYGPINAGIVALDFFGAVSFIGMTPTEAKAAVASKFETGQIYAIYHEAGTMSRCIDSTTNQMTDAPGVYIGDTSAGKFSYAGSTSTLAAYEGYKAGKAAASP